MIEVIEEGHTPFNPSQPKYPKGRGGEAHALCMLLLRLMIAVCVCVRVRFFCKIYGVCVCVLPLSKYGERALSVKYVVCVCVRALSLNMARVC